MVDFWKGKRVLVTGHTGFVGSWLCTVLRERGADISGFSLQEEEGSLYSKIKNGLNMRSIYGDLRDKDAVGKCFRDVRPEVIFHMAAFGFVKECMQDPECAFSTNVLGTLNLLEAIVTAEEPVKIVIASSDKVYQNDGEIVRLFSEEEPLGASDPYSTSKASEDMLARCFFETYLKDSGASMCIVRPSNILGGGDHLMSRLIPGLFDSIRKGESPVIRNPEFVRPWQDVLDVTDAYLTLAENAIDGRCTIYNVGPEPGGIKSVGEIVDYVYELYGRNKSDADDIMYGEKSGKGEENVEKAVLGLSIAKISNEVGWKPLMSIEGILNNIYVFFERDDGNNTYSLCKEQIQNYCLRRKWHDSVGE